jgi:hypothetical protein
MKQRLLVMNGQRIVQHEQEGQWQNDKVDRAGTVKPGIYNLYLASQADKTKTHDGVVLYADKESVFQQVGKSSSSMLGRISTKCLKAAATPASGTIRGGRLPRSWRRI